VITSSGSENRLEFANFIPRYLSVLGDASTPSNDPDEFLTIGT
jgi:hypothetical protein